MLLPVNKPNPLGNKMEKTHCARILLADDNVEMMEHVSAILEPEFEVIGKVANGDAVCGEVKNLKPDLVVLDISMGKQSGIKIAGRLRERGFAGEIVFLTVHEDPDFVTAAIGAGGRGYVVKSRVSGDLRLAVNAALLHQMFISAPMKHG
jgi:DNA-binding NarL/FixJ family response regulator